MNAPPLLDPKTRRTLRTLELVGGLFGWLWLASIGFSLWFLFSAVFGSGRWASFFWSFGLGFVCKQMLRGFTENKNRIAYERQLFALGVPADQTYAAWVRVQAGEGNLLAELIEQRKTA